MIDKIVTIIKSIKKHGLVFLVVIIIVTPAVWEVSQFFLKERIETLKAQIELLQEQKLVLEKKLLEPPVPPDNQTSSESSTQPNSSVKESSRLPRVDNPNRPTKEEIRKLARFYGLFNHWKVNPHLRFKEGDISYWSEQGMTEKELKREFESRQTVLRRAEETGEKIPSQGDLSHRAEQLQAINQD
ncbi:MAG: hypothetical protein JRI36_13435 [Deltaproteobacteria bacterium]|nr:hypothetical protein [Deltaproteobacteria bacterium]